MNGNKTSINPWDVRIEVLWTDWLIYLLVIIVVAFVLYALRREHLRAPWRQVLRRRLAMASLLVLSTYVVIGLLDSVHFRLPLDGVAENGPVRYSSEVSSLLDRIILPLKTRVEKTYSAPFATHLYSKETIEFPDGRTVRDYPRLRFGGAHLEDPPRARAADITRHVLAALLQGAALWLLVAGVLMVWLARRRGTSAVQVSRDVLYGRTAVAWNSILITLAVLMVLGVLAVNLGTRYHIFGTDKVGQDVFYLSLKSVRTGLVIGLLTTLVMLPFAVLLGIMAGYFRGWVDDVIQYVYTTLSSIPGVLLIASVVLLMQVYISNHPEQFTTITQRADARLLFLCLILGITTWTSLCRLLRGEALKLREVDYIQAATAFGVGHFTIITRHILPNVMHIVLIYVVIDFSGLVLAEAVLSYVGVGVDPSMNSWGNMINSARLELAREPVVWWSLLAAFVFMFTLVLAANLFSDAVRDAFDPRIRRR